MNARALVDRLARFPPALRAACALPDPADAGWTPSPKHWSIAQIVQHLLDEEQLDFRARLRLTLEAPDTPWPSLDPEGLARARGNHPERLATLLNDFDAQRNESIAWLSSLRDPDWARAHDHPRLGPIRAGDLLTAWAAHDALHLRQVAKRLHQLAARDAPTFTTRYAGDWTA